MKEYLQKQWIEEELRWWGIPGVSVGIVETDADGTPCAEFLQGYGFRDLEQRLPMTASSLGGIASCSKAFTSAVIGALVDEGRLDFDRPIHDYLPDFALMDPFATKECCLRDILYHRTGIAGHDAMWPNPGWTTDDFIYRMRYLTPNQPFRSVAQYSNTMYDLAGFIAEKVSGESYPELVRSRILDPLGMTRTNLSLKKTQEDADWAAGYFAEEIGPGCEELTALFSGKNHRAGDPSQSDRKVLAEDENFSGKDNRTGDLSPARRLSPEAGLAKENSPAYFRGKTGTGSRPEGALSYHLRRMDGWDMNPIGNPAAGVNSCAQDMLHWITLHLNNGIYQGKRLFSEAVMHELHEPGMNMDPFPWRFEEVPGFGFYGMAWKTAVYRGMRMIYHCGEIEGYSSITMFLPDHHFGMFVLCNRHTMCTPFLLELVYTAIDNALGYDETAPVDWAGRLHAFAHDFTGSCEDWQRDLMPEEIRARWKDADPVGISPAGRKDAGLGELPSVDGKDAGLGELSSAGGINTAGDCRNCAGIYENLAYGRLALSYGKPTGRIGVDCRTEGSSPSPVNLYLHFKQWILPLEPVPSLGSDVFRVQNVKEDTLFYTVPLVLRRDAESHKVTGFTLKLTREVPPEKFERVSAADL